MERDGHLHIGDVGYLDHDGFLYLNDRSTDMIISGGVNIYPAEIEACLLELDGVRDVAVFGIPDDEFGESIAAHVEAHGLTEDDVREHVRVNLAGYKVPKLVVFDDNLPREDTGKLFKRKIRARTGRPPADERPRRALGYRRTMLRLGRGRFADDRLLVMAIVNRTPDSFYDRGRTFGLDTGLERVHAVVEEGADLVDIGGVKAGPGDAVSRARRSTGRSPVRAAVRDAYRRPRDQRRHLAARGGRRGVRGRRRPDQRRLGRSGPGARRRRRGHGAGAGVHARRRRARRALLRTASLRRRGHRRAWRTSRRRRSAPWPRGRPRPRARRPGPRLRQEHLALARGHPAAGRAGRHRLPVLVPLSNKDFVGETLGLPSAGGSSGRSPPRPSALARRRVFRAHNVAETQQTLDMVAADQRRPAAGLTVRGLA